jgi:hypothetical protein
MLHITAKKRYKTCHLPELEREATSWEFDSKYCIHQMGQLRHRHFHEDLHFHEDPQLNIPCHVFELSESIPLLGHFDQLHLI